MRFVGPLEVSWESVGRCLGVPGVVLGSEFGVIFYRFSGSRRTSSQGGLWEPFWRHLGAVLGCFGAVLERLGAILGRLGTFWKGFGGIWCSFSVAFS